VSVHSALRSEPPIGASEGPSASLVDLTIGEEDIRGIEAAGAVPTVARMLLGAAGHPCLVTITLPETYLNLNYLLPVQAVNSRTRGHTRATTSGLDLDCTS
jgi:hypothetical protein